MPKNKKDKSGLYVAILIIISLILAGIIIYCLYWTQDAEEEEQTNNGITKEKNEDDDFMDLIVNDKEVNDNDDESINQKEEEAIEESEDQPVNTDDNLDAEKENVYIAVYGNSEKYSVEYPENWKPYEVANKNKVGFIPPGNSLSDEYAGDITISYKENPDKLSIDRYYDGINDVNLFEDASGGFENKKRGNYEVYIFREVIGYVPSTVAVIVLDGAFVEIIDMQNKHQNNDIFGNFIETFKEES